MNTRLLWLPALALLGLFASRDAVAQGKEVAFHMQCDRTGPTEIVGSVICVGVHDYVDLMNSKGGVDAYRIKLIDIDNQYKVPPAVEAFQREKEAGAVTMAIYGTPQMLALAHFVSIAKGSTPTGRVRRKPLTVQQWRQNHADPDKEQRDLCTSAAA